MNATEENSSAVKPVPSRRGPASKTTSTAPRISGQLRVNSRGFAFIDGEESLFCPPGTFKGLLDADEVTAVPVGDRAGDITFVRRHRRQLIGTVQSVAEGTVTVTVDPYIADMTMVATTDLLFSCGDTVIVHLDSDSTVITGTAEHSSDPARDRVLVRNLLPRTGPTTSDAPAVAALGPNSRRRDLRDVVTLTIDDSHSRDLDDALSVRGADEQGCVTLSVHISDVAEHVTPGGDADMGAADISTSIYLHPWVRPMLHHDLSEQHLSLLPGAERDALSVDMRVDPTGNIVSVDVYESRIRSNGRLDYELASKALRRENVDVDEDVVETLRWLHTVSSRLASERQRRGSMPARFSDPELHGQGPARDLIERCMVAANESVAHWMADRGLKGLWRTHATPDAEAAAELEELSAHLGYHAAFGPNLTPRALAALDLQMQDADEATLGLWHATLDRMPKALYQSTPGAHFGLASECYTHFTSPIRRYADLVVHRAVKAHLRGEQVTISGLDELAAHINDCAGRASRAEAQLRNAERLGRLEVGTVTKGCVTSVRDSSIRVWLNNSVRAHMSFRSMTGRWRRDGMRATNGTSTISPGQYVNVKISAIDIDSGIVEVRRLK